jgi:hypothetical protein
MVEFCEDYSIPTNEYALLSKHFYITFLRKIDFIIKIPTKPKDTTSCFEIFVCQINPEYDNF